MLRFRGNSDTYPRRASAASALGSTDPRRCEREALLFILTRCFNLVATSIFFWGGWPEAAPRMWIDRNAD